MSHYVYILKCFDNSFYVGCSDNLKNRVSYHNKGLVNSTKEKLPVLLLWYCCFNNKTKALQFERYLKHGSGFAFTRKHLV